MKKLSVILTATLCFLALSLQNSQAQTTRAATSSTNLSAAYYVNGSIEGSIFIKKADIPNSTSIYQISQAVQQGLKAFQFAPQNNGLLSDQYIHVAKGQILNTNTVVNIQSSNDAFTIKYTIQNVPIMKPVMVKLVGNAAKNIRFAVDPLLKNFPVAYLTSCDRTFECYNFRGVFIPIIK